jgi:hypothetical protein
MAIFFWAAMGRHLSLLQKSVTFAQACNLWLLAVFRPTGCKTAVFKRLLLQN